MSPVDPLMAARQVKHALFVVNKRRRRTQRALRFAAVTAAAPWHARLTTYEFDAARYRRSFVARTPPAPDGPQELPRRVVTLWLGDNPLTPRRRANLDVMRDRIGLPVELVTRENLDQWLVPGHPLHPAYENLSLVHRSDYLRAYLMHHHGGGYCDLKAPVTSWEAAFARMVNDPITWMTGFPELNAASMTRLPGALGQDLACRYSQLVGMSGFILRSHTPLTAEWLREVERRLDYYADQAAEFPGEERGEVVGYPISWTRLLGGVLHPLQLKYLARVRQDPDLLLDFEDYK
ncbi:hypothetical protein QWJ06_11405 [Kocuria rhizophila]|uniref:hypothetical protein n=1 Tax=Kocuria rhizophila TaxID=72000 RepID=UPI0003029072|nr:hypothetical protein [Kocuria rhizophila]MBO4145801.1 hypothetical protein [Kocuria rhizophila]MDN3227318.1 hypothetical protein [Kocuria rhizophila]QTK30960.1 hypothetical protein J5U48_08110 [Kocuria rhizophila]